MNHISTTDAFRVPTNDAFRAFDAVRFLVGEVGQCIITRGPRIGEVHGKDLPLSDKGGV